MVEKEAIENNISDFSTPPIRFAPTNGKVEYPDSDGKPMAETEIHRDAITNALLILIEAFKDDPDVCVSGNMLMYYIKGNPRKSVSPDIFVSFGVGKKRRRTYNIWEEGKPPDFVLEFSSKKTHKKDQKQKKLLYELIGVKEYFLFDPDKKYLPSPIMGFHLVDGKYVSLSTSRDGSITSEVLNLELRMRGEFLGFYDTVKSKWLETPEDIQAERADRETERADRETERADRETERAAKLQAELDRLKAKITS